MAGMLSEATGHRPEAHLPNAENNPEPSGWRMAVVRLGCRGHGRRRRGSPRDPRSGREPPHRAASSRAAGARRA